MYCGINFSKSSIPHPLKICHHLASTSSTTISRGTNVTYVGSLKSVNSSKYYFAPENSSPQLVLDVAYCFSVIVASADSSRFLYSALLARSDLLFYVAHVGDSSVYFSLGGVKRFQLHELCAVGPVWR